MPVGVKTPILAASTPSLLQSASNFSHFAGGTAKTFVLVLRDPDLGISSPFVLQGCLIQPKFCPDRLAHFSRRRYESGPAIGDRVVEARIASLQQDIEDHLLRDGIPNLNGTQRSIRFLSVSSHY